jgi:hypothetical protein
MLSLKRGNQRLQFKARAGGACTQEVMRAKKVAHSCQRPPFYARVSYYARRRPQRPRYYARVGWW